VKGGVNHSFLNLAPDKGG